ncbi:MAG: hypothetical protein V4664_04235 [Patescibacteria group bacterium]
MTPQFYLPQIEEFHVGFEFESKTDTDTWIKETFATNFTHHNSKDISRGISQKAVRVKYLDRQDIESVLGVKQLNNHETELNFQFGNKKYGHYEIDYDTEEYKLIIEEWYQPQMVGHDTGKRNCNTLFNGTILNKSELKTLMIQLNIK